MPFVGLQFCKSVADASFNLVLVLSIFYSNAQFYCLWILSMTGLVASFNMEVGITGAILTKLDGDSRGGAALSVKEVDNNSMLNQHSIGLLCRPLSRIFYFQKLFKKEF